MKKILFLICTAFLFLQACSSSDSGNDNSQNNTSDNSLLLRKWYLVSQTYNGEKSNGYRCSNGNRDYFEFKEPNTLNYYYVISSSNCNYTSEGPFNWTKKGNVISVYHNSNLVRTMAINELTATTFSFVNTEAGNGQSSLYVYNSY